MATIRGGNGLKGAGLLLLIAVVGAVLFFGPALKKAPDTESPVNLPSMTHIPPEGTLHIETQQPASR